MVKTILFIVMFLSPIIGYGERQTNLHSDYVSKSMRSPFFQSWLRWSTFYFNIHFYNYDSADKIISKIDDLYERIIENFNWLILKPPYRNNIYIYGSREAYSKNTGMSKWAGGHVDLSKKSLYTYDQDMLLENVMVHELTHLIFDSYMGYPRKVAISWLHEGMAVYMEKRILDHKWNMKVLKDILKEGGDIDTERLMQVYVGHFVNREDIALWYFMVASLVAYMWTFDEDLFKTFIDNLKRFNNINEALKVTYPLDYPSIKILDRSWKKWVLEQEDVI